MKLILTLLITLIPFLGFTQKKLSIIYASSTKVKIYEQYSQISNWHLNPKIKLDVFTTNKLIGAETIKFKTDIDSISFKIKPGEKRDFIVLLNGKDSCLTRIQSSTIKNLSKLKPEIHDSIPFFINQYNTNYLKFVFNKTDSLIINFDTGATGVSFTTEAFKKKIKSNPKLYNTVYDLKIGKRNYKSKIHDIELAGNETDGLLGWDVFDGMIIELDYDRNEMVLHSKMPRQISNNNNYSKFKIRYIKNNPYIEIEIIQSDIKNKNWFLFDLGYQRTVMLDNDLLRENHFPTDKMEVIKKIIMHGTKGNDVPVLTSKFGDIKNWKFCIEKCSSSGFDTK